MYAIGSNSAYGLLKELIQVALIFGYSALLSDETVQEFCDFIDFQHQSRYRQDVSQCVQRCRTIS